MIDLTPLCIALMLIWAVGFFVWILLAKPTDKE